MEIHTGKHWETIRKALGCGAEVCETASAGQPVSVRIA